MDLTLVFTIFYQEQITEANQSIKNKTTEEQQLPVFI